MADIKIVILQEKIAVVGTGGIILGGLDDIGPAYYERES